MTSSRLRDAVWFLLGENEGEFVAEVKGLVQRKAGTAEEAMLELAEWTGKEI